MSGPGGNQDAPPSTLAANFANNLSNSRRASKHDEEEDFQRLLLELAKEEKDLSGSSPEIVLDHYHKLIYVVVRAVVEGLAEDKPQLNEPELLLQRATEGLHILNATIKETPEVLDHVADQSVQLNSGSNVPLWLWLFPRILALVGRQRCESMQEKITEFFQICFNEAYSSLQLWALTASFFRYLQHCASATLECLRNYKISPHGVSRAFSLKLPLAAIEDDVPIYGTPDLHSAGCSYVLNDIESAIRHCCYLLALIVNLTTSSAGSSYVTPAIEGHLAWILDSFVALREIENSIGLSSTWPKTSVDLCAVSLHAVYSLLKVLGRELPETVGRKGHGVLAHIVAEIVDFPGVLSQLNIQATFCHSLLELASASRRYESVLQTVVVKVLPAMQKLLDAEASSGMLSPDVLQCIAVIRQKCQRPGVSGKSHMSSPTSFETPAFLTSFNRLALGDDSEVEIDESRPNKRRKLSQSQNVLSVVVQQVYGFLGSQNASDLDGLSQVAAACFAQLKMADRCQALKQLGYVPCAQSGTLTLIYGEDGALGDSRCSVCDSAHQGDSIATECDERIAGEAIATLRALVDLPEFQESRRPRVLGMLALRRYAMHFQDSTLFDLETSALGQWCLMSFRSSMRELRIAAGRTLPAFLREGIEPEVLRRNKVNALDYLRALSEQNTAHLTETCILAWGQVGRISKDDELNLVLLRLVEYLGHTNQIASSAAFSEIVKISEVLDIPIAQLFRPFWRSIGPTAVKDLQTRPQTAQLVAELLRISVADLLISIQTYVLPWLILTRKRDVILRIMQARGDDSPETACIAESNIGPIMALLLVQNVPDLENVVMALFRNVSSEFDKWHFVELLKIEPLLIAVELLKNAAEEDNNRRLKIRQALQFLANHTYNGTTENHSSKKGNQVGPFLEHFVLPIMFHFSDLLNDTQSWQCIAEKRRSLKGIEEMLRVGKGYIRSALPQICACLQSAMASNDIRSLAFSAWKTMISSLDARDIGPMLETTFSTIILNWNVFDVTSREQCRVLIRFLLEQRKDVVREFIESIPSLGQIEELVDFNKLLSEMKTDIGVRQQYRSLAGRIGHEHESVVTLALIELKQYLRQHQSFLQASAVSEQPDSVIGETIRAILDACVKFGGGNLDIAQLSAECIGLVGCLDSNRVESVRGRREIVVVGNFEDKEETADFVLFILEEVFVKAFLSAKNPRTQAFLSYAMQELLKTSDITDICLKNRKAGEFTPTEPLYVKWLSLPEIVRQTLTPFLKSKYVLNEMTRVGTSYPIFENKANRKYGTWMRSFVLDLLRQPHNGYSLLIFAPLCRVIKIEDLSVANFLLPFVALHAVVLGSDDQRRDILSELLRVLSHDSSAESHSERTNLKLCSEAVFRILDYMSHWIQERQIKISLKRGYDSRWSHSDDDPSPPEPGIERVSDLLSAIPAELISHRAVECESYSRALFHWEQHIRQLREKSSNKIDMNPLLQRLQDIYTQIDEPDGIEGIAAHLHVLDIDQQILGHRKAGRWTAAQTWYEIQLAEDPHDVDVQINLLHCLKESGQHDVLLNYVEGMHKTSSAVSKLLPFATEASWATGRWDTLQKYLSLAPHDAEGDFNIGVGRILLALHKRDPTEYTSMTRTLRQQIACSLSPATTSSLSVCRDAMLKFHVLTELDMIAGPEHAGRKRILESLDRRLEAIGAYLNDKQYLLGIRRAAMQLTSLSFSKLDIASAWLTSARLARKGNSLHQSFNAVLHASQLGDESATIEHARLLWKEGHHRKAIQSLQGAIDTNAFISHNRGPIEDPTISAEGLAEQQNLLTARAHLLLAKWLDSAGHTYSVALRSQYQLAAKMHQTWEKGHYYLGRHYNKLLESEKALPPEQQAQQHLIGETARLVIENYLRSLTYGTKYVYQTLPRVITLWLDLGTQVNQPMDAKYGTKEFISKITAYRKEQLAMLHARFSKYINKMPAYIFYTALPQIVARIAHPNSEVYQFLQAIIIKVVSAHPQQALWTLLAVSTSTQPDRKNRGLTILTTLRNNNNPRKLDTGSQDLKNMIRNGERLASQLLMVCNAGDFQGNRSITASITRDLGFNHRICTPSPLCVPIESALTATLPTLTDNIRSHKAFSRDVVTVSQFNDEVLVLGSLQKPRKLTARGSDGQSYGLLCKPKDDLRKDQRLMEFNSMINRSLKRDAESSKRQLYIKTYAVTPLNEECGIIEWVDGLKTLRDILISLYKVRGIVLNHAEVKVYLDEACKGDDKLTYFTAKVLRMFPPVFHSWFVQQFPEPSAWFVARLKYTRSCAVMSMVGTILGLGDRHGENILFEEGNGGTFHVDFNCLFDKGLTFAQPERVPFRLTHNMSDAMGVYGYEGPFRKSSELTLKLLRQHEETLMTILEAFVYDPTLDLLTKKNDKRRREREDLGQVPDTAQGVLDSIRRKVRGLLVGESVPLGVEGQVDELIKQAASPKNLAAMYIGWCAFF